MASPAEAAPRFGLRPVAELDQPVYVAAPPGDARRLFVVGRRGVVWVRRSGRRGWRRFLDIRRLVRLDRPGRPEVDQRGLLSMAFDPDYRESGLLYLFYTHRDGRIHVDEFRRGRRASRRTVLTVPLTSRLDVGGGLQFGPDGLLYVGVGYGRDRESSQDLGLLPGKLLRLEPRSRGALPYLVPADNPFLGHPDARPEIWAYGLRNPWRFSFDRRTGSLVLADVGYDTVEEVNFLRRGAGAGANFGWPLFEGSRRESSGPRAGLVFPSLERRHGRATCAIIGGYVVRDRALRNLYGRYLYGDLCSGRLRSARVNARGSKGDRSEGLSLDLLTSFGEDGRGRLYAVSIEGGVYRLVPR
jgi:glucose/arabinose dehydrogenase